MAEQNPYIDENGKTDAETYLEGCLDGTYSVGKRIKQLAEVMLPQIRDGYKQWQYNPSYATRPVRFIENFCRFTTGKMKGKPFILEPYERMIVELTFGFVDGDGYRRFREVIVEIARKNGKALTISTQLPTPSGWRTMGEIHPGDYVFGQDGKPSRVIAESEIFHKETYRVTFEDGAVVDTSGDHIWTVQTKRSRRCANDYLPGKTRQVKRRKYRDGGWFETTTKEMFDDPCLIHRRSDGKGVEYKYRVPMSLPVEYPEKDLPIDPYTFGYWIGDGSSDGPEITVGLEDLREASNILESKGHTCTIKHCHGKAYKIRLDGKGPGRPNPFKNALHDMLVLNNKHIPDIYLQGSIEQRYELLRGLMDTDGYVSKAGQCQFVQKSEVIVDQLIELCSSLGIKANKSSKIARCNGKPAGMVYMVEFWTDKAHSCFHLKRKHNRLKDKLAPRMSCKSIVSIERIPNEPTKCIAIDNPSHLYLAGRQYTATHNTQLCAALNVYMLMADNESGAECYNCATTTSQASLCYGTTNDMIGKNPQLQKRIRRGKIQKRNINGLNYDATNSYLCTISAQGSGNLDGLNTHFAVYDELAACKDGGATYDLISESMSSTSRTQPLVFIISTENFVRFDIWDERKAYAIGWLDGTVKDDRLLPIMYEIDSLADIDDETHGWPKANPGLGTVKSIDYLRDRVLKAQQSPARKPSMLTKDFNWPANEYSSFLTMEECHNPETFEFNPATDKYCCVGFDLADRGDLNAAVAMYMRPGDDRIYERAMFWIAESQVEINLQNMKERDRVPYRIWAANDWLRIIPSDKVNQRVIIDWINELVADGLYPRFVGYDAWHVDDWTERELEMMVGKENFESIPQWPKNLSPAMKEHQIDLRAHRIINPSPITEWCRANVQSKPPDANNNYFQQKKDLKPNKRIDGYMAELFAYIELINHMEEYKQLIGWYPPETNSNP